MWLLFLLMVKKYSLRNVLWTARRRVTSHRMKQIKQNMSKEAEELDNEEENEELFGDIGK